MTSRSIASVVEDLHRAQHAWRSTAWPQREAIAKRFAALIAERSRELHAQIETPQRRDYRETLSAELLPLADASRWLALEARKVLEPRRIATRGTPMWLGRLQSKVVREPLGVIAILGTWNYPFFLVGVQVLQAVMAGNAVIIKPADGCAAASHYLRTLLIAAGMPMELVEVVDSSVATAQEILRSPIDKLVMTGSSQTGRKVLALLADQIVPSVMELSGCDAMFLLEDFDCQRAVAALIFTLRLNGGASCLAPRRVFVPLHHMTKLEGMLQSQLHQIPPTVVHESTLRALRPHLEDCRQRWLLPNDEVPESRLSPMEWLTEGRPLVFTNVSPEFPLANMDLFAPLVMLIPYSRITDAIEMNRRCPYALTCSIFGSEERAEQLAQHVEAGVVVINDVVVPTVDPRLPFGGVRESGFGSTRGIEGLLEMTYPKVITARRGKSLRHLEPPAARDEKVLEGLLQWLHAGTWSKRMAGLRGLIQAIRAPVTEPTNKPRNKRPSTQEDET